MRRHDDTRGKEFSTRSAVSAQQSVACLRGVQLSLSARLGGIARHVKSGLRRTGLFERFTRTMRDPLS